MDNNQERDFVEEAYNRDLCPGCDHSPCFDPEQCKADNEDIGCEGHETLRGDMMGESIYCDGSCRRYDVHDLSEMEYHAG